MAWDLKEALEYYRKLGAAREQTLLVELLREIQAERGSISMAVVTEIAEGYGIPASLPLALIRRYPSLRLSQTHTLELCCGKNCGKTTRLREFLEKTTVPQGITVKFVPCMRQCGQGPNLRWDGRLYHKADEALLRRLLSQTK